MKFHCYRTGSKLANGLEKLRLVLEVEGKEVFNVMVTSGQPHAQHFRKAGKNVPGSMEPAPQGEYVVSDIKWAGSKDQWNRTFNAGIGPVFIPITCKAEKNRGDFGIHNDHNILTAPGSAGCIVLQTLEEVQHLVTILRKYDPKILNVNWGL
jgi:lysozyme